MLFCPNCNNFFNIAKKDDSIQTGGKQKIDVDYEQIIDAMINNDDINFKDIEPYIDTLLKSTYYQKLPQIQKSYVYNKIQDMLNLEKKEIEPMTKNKSEPGKAIYLCKKCGYNQDILPGSEILNRASQNMAQNYTVSDYKDMLNSKILPYTRKYYCPNNECKSHTDPKVREAIFFRLNNTYQVKYICTACKTDF